MLSLVIADRSPVTQDIKSYGSCQPDSITCLVSIDLLSDPHSCYVPITTFLTLTREPQPLKESGAPAELGHSDARVPRGWGAETLVLLLRSTLGGFDPYLSGKGPVSNCSCRKWNVQRGAPHRHLYSLSKCPLLLRRFPNSTTILAPKEENSDALTTGPNRYLQQPSWFLLPGASLLIVSFNLPWSHALASQ